MPKKDTIEERIKEFRERTKLVYKAHDEHIKNCEGLNPSNTEEDVLGILREALSQTAEEARREERERIIEIVKAQKQEIQSSPNETKESGYISRENLLQALNKEDE